MRSCGRAEVRRGGRTGGVCAATRGPARRGGAGTAGRQVHSRAVADARARVRPARRARARPTRAPRGRRLWRRRHAGAPRHCHGALAVVPLPCRRRTSRHLPRPGREVGVPVEPSCSQQRKQQQEGVCTRDRGACCCGWCPRCTCARGVSACTRCEWGQCAHASTSRLCDPRHACMPHSSALWRPAPTRRVPGPPHCTRLVPSPVPVRPRSSLRPPPCRHFSYSCLCSFCCLQLLFLFHRHLTCEL